ncbi:uncharacterized protein [Dermacentor albipictus]|uniref:uncharacterized protein isoform X4 n=1 Tax=Dermacentor albipictus TaxID=60249 RepID=UPI0038FC5CD3
MEGSGDEVNADDRAMNGPTAPATDDDRCPDDGMCTCGKPVKPLVRRVIAGALVMVLTSAAINQVAAFAQYGVTSLVALAVSGMGDEDVYDDWSVFDAEMSQPSFIEPPTPSTNATCPALEDGLSGQLLLTELVSASLVMALRSRFVPSYERLQQLATSLL